MSKSDQHSPVVTFVDERRETPCAGVERFITASCTFGQQVWVTYYANATSIGAARGRRRLEAINRLLHFMGGAAVLAYADIPQELLPPGEKDATDDIPRMSRTDNIWSMVVLSGMAASVARLMRSGVSVGAVSLYYDRKDLTAAHRLQFENALRDFFPKMARAAAEGYPELVGADPNGLVFDVIESVSKPTDGTPPDARQQGTNLAHHLCSQAPIIIKRGSAGRIIVGDHSDVIRSMISKFDGHADDGSDE